MRIALLLCSYAAGIVCASLLPTLSANWLLPLAFLPLLCFFGRRRPVAVSLLLAIFAFVSGLVLYQYTRWPAPAITHISNRTGSDAQTVDGRVMAHVARSGGGFFLDLDTLRCGSAPPLAPCAGRLRLFVERGPAPVTTGEIIRFQARLRQPLLFGTPGEFDFPRHLAVSDIHVTASLASADEFVRLADRPPSWYDLIERGRTATGRHIDSSVPPQLAPLVRALAIGTRDGLAPEVTNLLARSGISHLFSISGLHFGLLACALYAILLSGYRRSTRLLLMAPPARVLPLCIIPFLIFYLFWTGAGFATLRAALMLLAMSLLLLLRRRCAPLDLLWAAALGILLLSPLALFEPSFQLSFAAVAGIVCAHHRYAPLLAARPQWLRWSATLLLSSLAATVATLPLVLWHFHLLAPAGIFINLLAIPLVGWLSVPLAIFGCLCLPFWETGATLGFQGCATTLRWLLQLVEAFVALPGCGGITCYPSLALTASLTLLVVAIFVAQNWRTLRLTMLIASLALLPWTGPDTERLSVTAFSVGQGESLLLSLAGRQILIDAGGLYGDRFDTGRQLVAPALGRLGIRSLDAVVVTHPHPDHSKGMAAILTDFPCQLLFVGEPAAIPAELLAASRAQQLPISTLQPGWTQLVADGDKHLAIYRPPADQSGNDASLVVYAAAYGQGVLLPADLEAAGVRELLRHPLPGPVTLLKLPHHGSRKSQPDLLLDRCRPQTTFVSAGRDNRFGFPHAEVVAALADRHIPLDRTDLDGTLRFVATPDGWQRKPLVTRLFH